MRNQLRFLLSFILCSFYSSLLLAQSNYPEFLEQKQKENELREQAIGEVKKKRQIEIQKQEKALELYRQNKVKQKAPLIENSKEYLIEKKTQAQRESALALEEKKFSEKRKVRAEKLKKTNQQELEELGINTNRERVDWNKRTKYLTSGGASQGVKRPSWRDTSNDRRDNEQDLAPPRGDRDNEPAAEPPVFEAPPPLPEPSPPDEFNTPPGDGLVSPPEFDDDF